MSSRLTVSNLVAGYAETIVIDDVSFEVPASGTLGILGRNGVGKTTLLNTLAGFTTLHSGTIELGGQRIEKVAPFQRNRMGLACVPQAREIFPSLTVEENLRVAMRPGGWTLEAVYEMFPGLKNRQRNYGNQLSGGEQQMLAIGRALVGAPSVILLDEPMEGLAPIVVETVYHALCKIRDNDGPTIVLVEQKPDLVLSFTDQAIVLDRGRITYSGKSAELRADKAAQEALMGAVAKV